MCTNLPCQLRDGQKALQYLCDKLGVEDGGTTADGLFTVQHCECLGACADARWRWSMTVRWSAS